MTAGSTPPPGSDDLQPDPAWVGGVPNPPFVLLPEPVQLFQSRARRFAFLAETSELAPYLDFLARLARLQARLAVTLPPVMPVPAARVAEAARGALPPVDRSVLAADVALVATLDALTAAAAELDMPEAARAALEAVRSTDADDRRGLLANVLRDHVPGNSVAPHLFVAAAVQVHLARLAATLDAGAVKPVHVGTCPVCGGRPVTSSVMGTQGVENIRYAACCCCATQWNEVRVKCLCCGSTKGISYRSVETVDATVKAETCRQCNSWIKIFYAIRNPGLDPVADDIGSLGLDILMQDTPFRRGGFNPYLIGY